MTYHVKLTTQAIEQILETVAYISGELLSPETASRWLARLKAKIATLSETPSRVPLTSEEPWRSEGIHRLVFENFFIYFWIDESQQAVWIIAVLYSRRDQRIALMNVPL